MKSAHDIAETLGRRAIANRLGVGLSAVNNALDRGGFPASWFRSVRDMCRDAGLECPEDAFNFKSPSEGCATTEAVAQ